MLSVNNMYGQAASIDGLASFTAPSAAAIPNIVNSPISPATGIPDVNFPFFSLPTHSKDISINAGMLYHPGNSGKYSPGTELGLGWLLYGVSGYIYREVIGNVPDSETTGGNDVFYFNFLGRSGRFLFKSSASGPYIQKIILDKIDITFTNDDGALQFKIRDEGGNTFFFDIPDKSYMSGKEFTNTYYLSKIVTANNLEILNFEYQEDNYNLTLADYPYSMAVKSLKLSKINSPGFGSIALTYNFNSSLRNSFNDPFQLQTIELKDNHNKTINKYGFEQEIRPFSFPNYPTSTSGLCQQVFTPTKRILKKLIKYNKLDETEITKFDYKFDTFQSIWTEAACGCFNDEKNPKYLGIGLLNKITYPTGAETRYEYEPSEYYVNKNTPTYKLYNAPPFTIVDREAQYYEDLAILNFDTHNGKLILFSIPDDVPVSYLYICTIVNTYYSPCEDPLSPYDCSMTPFINVNIPDDSDTPNGYTPGHHVAEITGTGGKGSVIIKRIKYKSDPIANYSTGYGVRIKSISYYENGVLVEGLTKTYDYKKFDENITSGILSPGSGEGEAVIYKNVKETTGNNNGYTKYYFKTLADFPENLDNDGNVGTAGLKYFNIYNNGLLEKVEVYNSANTLLSSESNTYELYEMAGNYSIPYASNVENAIIKKGTTTSTVYTPSGNLVQTQEYNRDTKDLNIYNRKIVAADGTVTEENILYAWQYQLVSQKLWMAHIMNVPIVSETKKNGKTISNGEVKYNDPSNFYPTSIVSTNPNDSSLKTTVSYDIYDTKGNVKQFTTVSDEASGQGFPTTIIWGYDDTYPIAKIEGAMLSDIGSLATDMITKSNLDTDEVSEKTLMQALDTFRTNPSLKKFRITTYTYDPLVGVTSVTPPTGIREVYKYDKNNRLQYIIDVNGNILKDYRYNTKPQP